MNTSTYPNNEHTLCQEQIKIFERRKQLKNLNKKILSENQSAFGHVFLLYGIAHFLWGSSFALALFQFELSILRLLIILSPKKQIFQ